ncbi:hypothetical protein [Rhodobacter lacus]|uniref:Uncharacterized protein n=1 Tax=Rhodobacter lacus TaxID=1641972 RepID=A0ABW5A7N5_9RHOB
MVSGIFRFIIGLAFGLACILVLSPAVAAFQSEQSSFAVSATIIVVLLVCALVTFAPNIRRAFGRSFLALGACFIFLPVSAMLLSGRATNEVVTQASANDQAAAMIGSGLAGIAVTGFATFFGLILGAICVITGMVLVLGGRREVVIVERYK